MYFLSVYRVFVSVFKEVGVGAQGVIFELFSRHFGLDSGFLIPVTGRAFSQPMT